jgi:hypothetical protein
MATTYAPLLSFNRGIISKTTLARTDLDRTRLSAEIMTNFLPKTQGPMILRPGTKYVGNSINDTGAAWVEFVASTTETALLELTNQKMRVWLPSDTGNTWETPNQTGLLVPMARPSVGTAVSISDTGWYDDSIGGNAATTTSSIIPMMVSETTNRVKITASSSTDAGAFGGLPWNAADGNFGTFWRDTGSPTTPATPSWLNVDLDTGAKTQNYVAVGSYTIRSANAATFLDNAPRAWRLITGDYDTGTYATDTGKWTLEDERTSEIDWGVSEQRTYTLPGSDTGTVEARRHWRLLVVSTDTGNAAGDGSGAAVELAEIELLSTNAVNQKLVLNSGAIGSTARAKKTVTVDTGDSEVEHSLDIHVGRGPVTIRVGSTDGDDDYVSETSIGTGYHNLAFVPSGTFYITLQTANDVSRIVESLSIGDSGTVEIKTPWAASNLDSIRYDQSADIVYADCVGVSPYKIERRGTGRSWSVVKYEPDNGPFLAGRTSNAKLSIAGKYGNTVLYSDIPFFRSSQVGSLFEITHNGQSGEFALGYTDAETNVIEVTGINDTGTPTAENERRLVVSASGSYTGELTIERSFDSPDFGYKKVTKSHVTSGNATDTGTFTTTIDDEDDNVTVFYRVRMSNYTSGAAIVSITYKNGSVTGRAKVTDYVTNQQVNVEVIDQFSDTGGSEVWREGAWSERRGYPTAVALHEGRLWHAGAANVWGSVSDDYENFDATLEGESAPISRTLGSGPVDAIQYLLSLLRLVAGTSGSEIAIKSSSIDETLTPTNASANAFSTQGSATLRAMKMDNRGLFIQRSGERLYLFGIGTSASSFNEYESTELTILTPDVLRTGVVSIAIQRQPDTRIHCVLADGTVAILTYEPQEEVLAWSKWVTDTGSDSAVERAMVLPGDVEDNVYYHVRRTINGVTRRFLEKWAMESECQGDTGLSWLMDCAVSYTDTGATALIPDFAEHIGGQTIAAWGNDTGQSNSYGKDLTPDDTGGDQVLLSLDTGGDLTMTDSGVKHVVGGLPYRADYKSTKLAYGVQGSTAMTMVKRIDRIALILSQTHNNALFMGSDTGHLDPMPRVIDNGSTVDADKIFSEYDKFAHAFDGDYDEDSRIYVRAKAPRPATIMALLPRVTTNER